MPIDIDTLSESELIDLNHRIVARLQFLRQVEAHCSMIEFRIGQRVRFHPPGREAVTGVITRYNRKTVSILTEEGQRWTVAPQLLERIAAATSAPVEPGNLLAIARDKSGDTI
ncbi:MAG TPA: hypothetical protein VMF03_19365 [Steroidobacteraceae bacterium]|nr:hypothetical protein [Steroidobacteraceae bacterium]